MLNSYPAETHSSNGSPTHINLLAKVYDPLYFGHKQDDAYPFFCGDRDSCMRPQHPEFCLSFKEQYTQGLRTGP
ncbi:hypothetical protein I7I53_03879 [Histoplasma capsulatum var. duboisii H88]|uniref:Uncharacterized protein n=1 Tax=Ajellomyces capsulatus (strain H88) TaxID=544711 RepID=A0A8A1LPL8_AJEC8|nr:hypothetical protein I7I53_03879 [Histoplasma capsulatum var. duboisii H88]